MTASLQVLRWIVLFLAAGRSWGDAQQIILPPCAAAAASAVGSGTGSLTVGDGGVLRIEGTATAFGTYSDNTKRDAAVLDYRLPRAQALPEGTDQLEMSYRRSDGQGLAMLKLLIEDARGGTWAVGTRLGGGNSRIDPAGSLSQLETFAFDTSEVGRLDPWVMTPLDAGRFDAYDLPRPPFRLAGFRVILAGAMQKPLSVEIRDLRVKEPGRRIDPYWLLFTERSWQLRVRAGWKAQESGWGDGFSVPRLTAADLNLAAGRYRIGWEILATNQCGILASGEEDAELPGPVPFSLDFPLLSAGTYHVRVVATKEGDKAGAEYFLTYVVVRNGKAPPAAPLPSGKPLRLEIGQGGVFPDGEARIRIASLGRDAAGSVEWTAEATDGRTVQTGTVSAGEEGLVTLRKATDGEAVLWITAKWKVDGAVRDVCRRVVGFAVPAGPDGSPGGQPNGKLAALQGQFLRTKGDWDEGGTPVATWSKQVFQDFGPWIEEAKATGYNVVELAAPWWDLNPLPGVYQFDPLDKLVGLAKERGLKVVLRVHPAPDNVPPWIPREFQADPSGSVNGLWSGQNTFVYSPASRPMRQGLDAFLTALAGHYRDDADVLGYSLTSLYFDHDLLDLPWCAQAVDYSDAARVGFAAFLKERYQGDLARLGSAHGTAYAAWEGVPLPTPSPEFDAAGRLKPRTDALWSDWMDYKLSVMEGFRLDCGAALRKGDPACWVALYASDILTFCPDRMAKASYAMACGGMEFVYPPARLPMSVRFEPIGKATRTAPLADVGLSNVLLAAPPGYDAFFNYWRAPWRLASVDAPVGDAERRLRQWFSVIDRVLGAAPLDDGGAPRHGVYLDTVEIQKSILQNTFTGRLDDFLKPYLFRAGTDAVRVDACRIADGPPPDFSGYSYVYVPYSTMMLDRRTAGALVDYVKAGGRLVLEATSGYWSDDAKASNFLASSFGLPEAVPAPTGAGAASESAAWAAGSGFGRLPLSFRTRPFLPPVNDQPLPWIHTISGSFFRPFRFASGEPNGATIEARYADGAPALLRFPFGKGEVLYFGGTLNWLDCPRLASAVDRWAAQGGKGAFLSESASAPGLIAKAFVKDGRLLEIGRRFIGQDDLAALEDGKVRETVKDAASVPVAFPAAALRASRYQVRDFLNGTDFGTLSAADLKRGVSVGLTPGQAFLLEASPLP